MIMANKLILEQKTGSLKKREIIINDQPIQTPSQIVTNTMTFSLMKLSIEQN